MIAKFRKWDILNVGIQKLEGNFEFITVFLDIFVNLPFTFYSGIHPTM